MSTKKIQIVGSLVPDVATSDQNGLMSSADKAKLDGIAFGATNTAVDDAISDTSANPVQNKVIKAYVDDEFEAIRDAMDSLEMAIDDKADKTEATTTASGLMSAADKVKLNNSVTMSEVENYIDEVILGGTW